MWVYFYKFLISNAFQHSLGIHGASTSDNKGLVGAIPTGITRFLEYVDGSIMTDGYFSDASGTWIGDILYSTELMNCFIINEEGNVVKCEKKCTAANGSPMECEQVICEKTIIPWDRALCLDRSSTVPSKVTLDDALVISITVSVFLPNSRAHY